MSLAGASVLIIGGGSGIGRATAAAAVEAGCAVTIAGRGREALKRAADEIGGARIAVADVTDERSLEALFASTGELDHLVLPGSQARFGGARDLPLADAKASMESKFWGQYRAACMAMVRPSGSITLFSGAASRRPSAGSASLTAINAAVEALGRALALEFAPVRVNTVSPGLIADTGWSATMPEASRRAMFEGAAARSPLKRVGRPADVASVVLLLMANPNITGSVVDVDAGAVIA